MMNRTRTPLLGILAVLFVVSAARGQALEDPSVTSPAPPAIATLPLSAEQRSTLEQALRARNYRAMEELLVAEIEKNPKSPELLKFAASIFFLDGEYLNTAIALKKAEALAPLDNQSRFTLALAYVILDHRDWARPELETLAKSDPSAVLYPYWLGRIDYDAMQFTSAVANFRRALELDPAYMKTYDNLGLCYEALGQYDDAIRTYEQAMRLNREKSQPSPWPPVNLGTLLVKLGKLDEAEAALLESLRFDPRFPTARYQLGLVREKQKRDSEAIAELRRAAELNPNYAEPHYVLGRIYKRLGQMANAETAWATFQRIKRENPRKRPH
jgi:tetratricopeptide (TPR) repeat protein